MSMASKIGGKDPDFDDVKMMFDPAGVVPVSVVGTWDWDIISHVVRYDRGAAALLVADASLCDTPLDETAAWSNVYPDDVVWLKSEVAKVAKAGGLFLAEYRVNAPDGRLRWLLSRGRVHQNFLGLPVRGCGILIDITECRDAGDGYIVRAEPGSGDLLDQAASDCIRLHQALHSLDNALLCSLVDTLLLELGHEIARRMQG